MIRCGPNLVLVMIQTTVALEHDVGAATLRALSQLVPGAVPQLVFLVPPTVARTFKLPQRLLGEGNRPLKTRTKNPTHGQQFKWVLSKRDGQRVWNSCSVALSTLLTILNFFF